MAGGPTGSSDVERAAHLLVGRPTIETLDRWLALLLWVGVGSAFLAVNTFPVITNDSLLYIEHSHDLIGGGWVEYGYRQAGYPLFLAVTRG